MNVVLGIFAIPPLLLLLGLLLPLLAVVTWLVQRRRSAWRTPTRYGESQGSIGGGELKKADKTSSTTAPDDTIPAPVRKWSEPDDLVRSLSQIAIDTSSSDIKVFMQSIVARVREEEIIPSEEFSIDLAEELVDRIDDLGLIKRKASGDDAKRIDRFITSLTGLLESAEVKLLHSNTWNPEIQRALSKTPTEGVSEPTIASFGSTGISLHSRILRKQEVLLAIPLSSPNRS